MALPCMPSSARMPIEKIRIPISASISITPACDLTVRIVVSSADPRVVRVNGRVNRRIACAHVAAARDGQAQAAHGAALVLARTAGRIPDVDLCDREDARLNDHAAEAVELHVPGVA